MPTNIINVYIHKYIIDACKCPHIPQVSELRDSQGSKDETVAALMTALEDERNKFSSVEARLVYIHTRQTANIKCLNI